VAEHTERGRIGLTRGGDDRVWVVPPSAVGEAPKLDREREIGRSLFGAEDIEADGGGLAAHFAAAAYCTIPRASA
jgi:hypothetical protein